MPGVCLVLSKPQKLSLSPLRHSVVLESPLSLSLQVSTVLLAACFPLERRPLSAERPSSASNARSTKLRSND